LVDPRRVAPVTSIGLELFRELKRSFIFDDQQPDGVAREQLSSLQASADEQWNLLSQQLDRALAEAADQASPLDDEG
jgi:hypothetical protein